MMNNIVITGSTGILGIALIEKCIEEKVHVLAICRKGSSRIGNLPTSKYLEVVECNLDEISNYCSERKYDVLYHFAWEGTNKTSRNNVFIQNKNIQYTLDAVSLAKRLGCHTFIGAGSQAEFGRATEKLNPNTPTFPENAYGVAKLYAGQLSRILCEQINLKHIWMRILSVYGPHDQSNTMVMSTVNNLLEGKKIELTKSEQVWDFIYSYDAARAMYNLGISGKGNEIYCIGSGEGKSLKEYILEIQRTLNVKEDLLKFGAIPYSDNQVMYLCADIENLKNDIGFIVEINFQEGIKRIAENIQKTKRARCK